MQGITLSYVYVGMLLWNQGGYFFRPLYKTKITRVKILFRSKVEGLLFVFQPIEVKMINLPALLPIVFIDDRKRGTAHALPDAKLFAHGLDQRCFACSHFSGKKPHFNMLALPDQFGRCRFHLAQ